MKKKITVVDKTFTPIVVLVDASSAIYEDRGQRPGEQNLLSETTAKGDATIQNNGNELSEDTIRRVVEESMEAVLKMPKRKPMKRTALL